MLINESVLSESISYLSADHNHLNMKDMGNRARGEGKEGRGGIIGG